MSAPDRDGGPLEVRGVVRRYGAVTALDGVDLDVPAGATVALLGPSGCGKSTLLRLLAGLEAPDAGRITLAGEDLTAVPPRRRGVGMVFQDFALFPHLDVGANVAFALVEAGWSRAARRDRVAQLLDRVGLAGAERRRPHELSGGQQQRVALARALAPHPRTLLLDEPLSNLDRALRQDLEGELRELLATLDVRAVYVTHDQQEAFALGDVVALMRAGRIRRVGPPAALLDAPGDVWTASFLGVREVLPAAVGRRLGFGGPVLLRSDALTPDPGGRAFTVERVAPLGEELAFDLHDPDADVHLRWVGRPRELPAAPPGAGEVLRLRVPDTAWTPLEDAP